MKTRTLDIEAFQTIEIEEPSSIVFNQIRKLLENGTLKPGIKLPSEREMVDKFRVSRGHIRKALAKLEFYGIVQTIPHKGTVVANIGLKAIDELLSNVNSFNSRDIKSVLETRLVLEVEAAALAARRATDQEINEIEHIFKICKERELKKLPILEEDHIFHLKIAAASKNTVLASLITFLTPQVIAMNTNFRETDNDRFKTTMKEHEKIVKAIKARDPEKARQAMEHHMIMSAKRRIPDFDPA
jgi:GntR family transcriptional regulator, transcriptional repressor for pyruvate dehydrogenase complex